MATFVSTTLDKRTGATTTVFAPASISGGKGTLLAPATYAALSPSVELSSKTNGSGTRTSTIKISVPQIEGSGDVPVVVSRPFIECRIVVPTGTLQTDVNDLVGYLNDALSTGTTNVDDVMVNGVGVY